MKQSNFKTSDFDELEPNSGHQARFEKKLDKEFQMKTSWTWLTVAASLVLLLSIGLYQWNRNDSTQIVAAQTEEDNNDFPLKEAENYYENSFEKQFQSITSIYNGPESKQMIEESMILIKDLQIEYKKLEEDLKTTGDQRVATAMILNYKSRINILEALLKQLEYVNHLKNQKDEKINV